MGGQLITPGYWGQGNAQGNGSLSTPYSGSQRQLVTNPYLPTTPTAFQFWQRPVYTATSDGDGIHAGDLYCPGIEGPTYAANSDDYVLIGGIKTPGLARIEITDAGRDVDIKKPVGANGATITVHGARLSRFSIELRIWTPEQLRQLKLLWDQIYIPAKKNADTTQASIVANPLFLSTITALSSPNVSSKTGQATAPLAAPPQDVIVAYTVNHPVLDFNNIDGATILGGRGPSGTGSERVFVIEALQYKSPSSNVAVSTVKKSKEVRPAGSLLDDAGNRPTPGNDAANRGP